jgi:hypothetical protein
MPKNRPPIKSEEETLFEGLLGPDEALDLESAREILEAHGLNPSDLISNFKSKLEDEARKLRLQGTAVPPSMQQALQNLRTGPLERPDPSANDPKAWLNGLLSGTLESSQRQSAYSLRPRKPGEPLTTKDKEILDALTAEIEAEQRKD